MLNSISKSDYDMMVQRIGQDEADRRVKQYGWEIDTPEADFVPVQMASQKPEQMSGLDAIKSPAIGGGNMEDEDMNVADEDAADNAAADSDAADAYAGLGGLDAMDLSKPQDISRVILANARAQQRYYNNLAEQIKSRRYGPSGSEKLFALSAAFAAPTETRGFSGVMGNVMPLLQKFSELRRTGEEKRQEALQQLAQQRLAASKGDVTNMLALQRLMATYNKPKSPFAGAIWDDKEGRWRPRPGTEGAPPVLTAEEAIELAKDPKNIGMKFYTTDGREREIK